MDKNSDNLSGNEKSNFKKVSNSLIVSTILIVVIIVVLGILNYFHTQANLSRNAFNNLENISNSKTSSINYWRKDKLDDARLLMNDISHHDFLLNYEKGNSSEAQVLKWLKSLIVHEDITEFIIYDTKKVPLIFTDKKEYLLEKERIAAFENCLNTKDVIMSDFFTEEQKMNGLRIAIFIPIFKSSTDNREVSKVLMIDFATTKSLEKFVIEWPVTTESSEAMLIRDDGKDVMFLSDLKNKTNSALKFTVSKNDSNIVSVKAVNGLRGPYRGYDFSRKDVHAFIKEIPGTNWILVTKTDTDEIRQNTMMTSLYIVIITFVIVLLALSITYIFNKKNKAQFFKELYKDELQKNIQLERLKVLLNNANDCIILYDDKGNILDANSKTMETYGYTDEELKELNVSDLRAPEKRGDIKEIINALNHNEGMLFETLHQTKSGHIFPIEVSASRIDFEGKVYLQGISRDISSRKEFEEKLIESEEKFKSVFTYANDVMFIIDGPKLIAVNKNAESLFGFKREDMLKITPADISPEFQEDGKMSKEKFENYINKALNDEPQFFEWVHRNSDGAEFPTEVSLNSITINNKKYVLAVLRDITFRKILDKALKDKEQSLELALDGSELGYYDMNFQTGRVITNNRCFTMLGYDNDEVNHNRQWWRDLIHPDDEEKSTKAWDEYIAGKTNLYQVEVRMQMKDGSYKWILDKCKVFEVKPDGSPLRVVGTHMDITQRKSYEEAILKAKEAAEESNTLKSNFLTNMSHELRTPLTGILGFSELLSGELEDEEQKEMAELIFKGGKRLTNTLNSILDLSRLESNQLSASRSVFNVAEIVSESVGLYIKSAQSKGLDITYESPCETVNCNIDEKMMNDIMYNLLQNAITYTIKGDIKVTLDLVNTDEFNLAQIKVKDTGIGINPKFHKQIFEPFRQASEGLSRKFEGTGLGLTLTKKYAEMMDGSITLNSEEGQGSEFIISLPVVNFMYKPKYYSVTENTSEKNEKLKAIFIEDEIENFELLNMLLKPYMILDNYESSVKALEVIEQKHYDIIFMDIGLKEINGMEATKIIRLMENYKNTPIIAITAFAMQGDKERILLSGCNEYISKPFSKDRLFEVLGKYVDLGGGYR